MPIICRRYILTPSVPHLCKVGGKFPPAGENSPQLLWWRPKWCKVKYMVHGTRTWNLQLQWPGDQRSKSQETEVRCGGLAEASFSSFDPVGSSSVSSYCDLFEHRVTVTFDLLTEKLIVSRPCPVDHLCQLTSKSFIRCQSVMFTSLVTATNGHTHGRTTDNLIT